VRHLSNGILFCNKAYALFTIVSVKHRIIKRGVRVCFCVILEILSIELCTDPDIFLEIVIVFLYNVKSFVVYSVISSL
jgi:hypothetical protein